MGDRKITEYLTATGTSSTSTLTPSTTTTTSFGFHRTDVYQMMHAAAMEWMTMSDPHPETLFASLDVFNEMFKKCLEMKENSSLVNGRTTFGTDRFQDMIYLFILTQPKFRRLMNKESSQPYTPTPQTTTTSTTTTPPSYSFTDNNNNNNDCSSSSSSSLSSSSSSKHTNRILINKKRKNTHYSDEEQRVICNEYAAAPSQEKKHNVLLKYDIIRSDICNWRARAQTHNQSYHDDD